MIMFYKSSPGNDFSGTGSTAHLLCVGNRTRLSETMIRCSEVELSIVLRQAAPPIWDYE